MVRFSVHKKLLKGENVLIKSVKLVNDHGHLLGVLRYFCKVSCKYLVAVLLSVRIDIKIEYHMNAYMISN